MNTRIISFKASNIAFIPVTEETAHTAGRIALSTPRTALADATIAATAQIYAGGAIVTDDEHFNLINGVKKEWLKSI